MGEFVSFPSFHFLKERKVHKKLLILSTVIFVLLFSYILFNRPFNKGGIVYTNAKNESLLNESKAEVNESLIKTNETDKSKGIAINIRKGRIKIVE